MTLRIIFAFLIISKLNSPVFSQTDKWLRAFPITSYIVDGNDSIKIVQLEMPEQITLKQNQLGLIRGVYSPNQIDTAEKGYGRCQLIKGNYYYFAINTKNGMLLKAGDLLYTLLDKTNIFHGRFPKLASHFIRLESVYEEPFFDRYLIFDKWQEENEVSLLDSLVKDIQFTGKYFIENDSSMDKLINSGNYKGQKILTVMANCKTEDVTEFLDYMLARPRLYAGKSWKISEIFATWASEGAPSVIK